MHVTGSLEKPALAVSQTVNETIVIVGGGAAAQVCAETLRKRAHAPWRGRIVMVCNENCLPYDRPKLSKAMTSTSEALQLRPRDFYSNALIDTFLGGEVGHQATLLVALRSSRKV